MTSDELREIEVLRARINKWLNQTNNLNAKRKRLLKEKRMLLKELNELEAKYDKGRSK